MRKGVIGELLIIIALVASVSILVLTFTNQKDIPNIPRQSLSALEDIKDSLSKAILDWLSNGPINHPLVCNGLYPVQTSDLASTLKPYLERQLTTSQFNVNAGNITGIDILPDSIKVTLQNGSIIYNDSNIYSEDNFDKEYVFNMRLPLALQVVEDWARCDAGNLSKNLQDAFGQECFYSKKNLDYPSPTACAKDLMEITQRDRDYIMGHSLTSKDVAAGVKPSIDTLNEYFAGQKSCVAPKVADTGISCSYSLDNVQFENEMLPWSSEQVELVTDIPKKVVDFGDLYAQPDYLDYKAWVGDDSQVYRLPATIIPSPYSDAELKTTDFACEDTGRETVQPSVNTVPYPAEPGSKDVSTGDFTMNKGKPVLYVNMTRGAKFTLVVTCKDNRAALLGQPLEYQFKLRYGLREHCGPTILKDAHIDCGGCAPRAGINFDGCLAPKAPDCQSAMGYCTNGVVWMETVNSTTKPFGPYKGTVYDTLKDNEPLQEYVNKSCSSVAGFEDKWPLPKPGPDGKILNCMAPTMACCIVPGYVPDCSPALSMTNPGCFTDKQTYMGMCVGQGSCSSPDSCKQYKCDESTGYLCKQTGVNPTGTSCGTDGCYACNENGDCKYNTLKTGQNCSLGYAYQDSCRKDTCVDDGNFQGCQSVARTDIAQDGSVGCSSAYTTASFCGSPFCTNGLCTPKTTNQGVECGQSTVPAGDGLNTCTIIKRCSGAACIASDDPTDKTCTHNTGGGGTCGAGCESTNGDPNCYKIGCSPHSDPKCAC